MSKADNRKNHKDIAKIVDECRLYMAVDNVIFPYVITNVKREQNMLPPFIGNVYDKR